MAYSTTTTAPLDDGTGLKRGISMITSPGCRAALLTALFLTQPLLSTCRIPDEDISTAAVPTTIQLRPNDIIKSTLPPYGSGGRGRTGSTSSTSFNELQLNLCNSGFAGCYAGGDSIPEGGELIYATGPNVVTVNEICSNDVAELQSYLSEAWPTDYTYSAFMPAIDKRTAAPYKCKDGFQYGSAVLGRVAASKWTTFDAYGGKFIAQDSSNEERIFVCAYARGDHFTCTTHLSSSSEPLALSQCKALMFDAVPYLKGVAGAAGKTVVGGDFNLEYDTSDAENVQKCVPPGWTRKGDGDVQHVIYTNDLVFSKSKAWGLSYTDHDGWEVRLTG
ncbi:hypothetical protein M501DRAFT_1012761 [Patellaria atrata CBS 101060]|uniref:Endonuclease/exonuclease/phosphatase domain-containing protein n=1 Tax=Patellaria atrata CBS 101060 TaxID=1346257 RepID=A0A9P4SJ01_9PEZI|nr:hypothetical protein M501DRAFT_1012761 [Patellaria atrata CBS 101060]